MSSPPWAPAVDILRGNDHWFVKLELAGVGPDHVRISADANVLSVRGTRRDTVLAQGFSYQSLEINYSGFERRVKLPFEIDCSSLSWRYQDGMLLIQVQPKSG